MTARQERLADQRLYAIVTAEPGGTGPLLVTMGALAEAGVALFQLRLKGAPTAERVGWAARCREALPADVLLVVNDDLEAALAAEADGLHLGRDDAAALSDGPSGPRSVAAGLARARHRLGADRLLGSSTRTLAEVTAAREAGCDHVGFGAMAVSTTKGDTRPADPAELARCLTSHPDFPIFPLGGLGPHNLQLVADAGGRRAALGHALLDAADPAATVRACLEILSR